MKKSFENYFTIIEISIIMAIMALILTFSLPGLKWIIVGSSGDLGVNKLSSTISEARSKAIRNNIPMAVALNENFFLKDNTTIDGNKNYNITPYRSYRLAKNNGGSWEWADNSDWESLPKSFFLSTKTENNTEKAKSEKELDLSDLTQVSISGEDFYIISFNAQGKLVDLPSNAENSLYIYQGTYPQEVRLPNLANYKKIRSTLPALGSDNYYYPAYKIKLYQFSGKHKVMPGSEN